MELDLSKYGFYIWSRDKQKWVTVYIGFRQVIAELRDGYRKEGYCTAVEKRRPMNLYTNTDDEIREET